MTNELNKRRRWFRFSLRTLLVAMTLLCVWLGVQVNGARRQKEAVEAILKAGGEVGYDYQGVPMTLPTLTHTGGQLSTGIPLSLFSKYDIHPDATPPGPAWLYLKDVTMSERSTVKTSQISKRCSYSAVTLLTQHCRTWRLGKLKIVGLSHTQVTPSGIRELQKSLLNCQISGP